MDFKQAVINAGKEMVGKNLTVATWGNISVRDPESGNIYITPSGMDYSTLEEEDIVVLDQDGNVIEGKRIPSVEAPMHVLIYQNRMDVNAIIHTHPIDSTVFAILRKPIPVVTDELAQAIGGEVKVSEYALPGTTELAENVWKALGNNQACLIANHGAVNVGKDLKECFKVATVLETSARIYYKALCIGSPVVENEGDVAYMRDFALHKYGKGNEK